MSFDIDKTVMGMLAAIKGSAQKDWKEVRNTATQFFKMNKKRYGKLAHYYLTGSIDVESFESRIEDEKKMIEAELNTLTIIS